ncbi:hypothetical protein [Cryptosporangium sp. NPDC051539]|uniref:hypothetical protein n=1 Tax=Cryptosporangium sp. NPDC051539 TaxID=3363962 RepID=UPI0037B01503
MTPRITRHALVLAASVAAVLACPSPAHADTWPTSDAPPALVAADPVYGWSIDTPIDHLLPGQANAGAGFISDIQGYVPVQTFGIDFTRPIWPPRPPVHP